MWLQHSTGTSLSRRVRVKVTIIRRYAIESVISYATQRRCSVDGPAFVMCEFTRMVVSSQYLARYTPRDRGTGYGVGRSPRERGCVNAPLARAAESTLRHQRGGGHHLAASRAGTRRWHSPLALAVTSSTRPHFTRPQPGAARLPLWAAVCSPRGQEASRAALSCARELAGDLTASARLRLVGAGPLSRRYGP